MFNNDVLHIAKGAVPEEIAHEIGHFIDDKLISKSKRDKLLYEAVQDLTHDNVKSEMFVDAMGMEHKVIYLESNKFISDYQGRVYVESKEEVFADGNVRTDRMLEFVSEIFREYWKDPESLEINYPDYYALIKEAVK